MIHPFREGNNRSIREFIRQLAFENEQVTARKHFPPNRGVSME
ncbi:hypothetical protein [Desulfosporosinus sp. OT]|nr:hypothetical protein [Desulfosporosinus sp. OT]